MPRLMLIGAGGVPEAYDLSGTPLLAPSAPLVFNRVAYAAAHMVVDPRAAGDPWIARPIDWERTLAFRHHLWDLGLGVAEAMDTAQRGMGLAWPEARLLIERCLAEAAARPGAAVAAGVGTDHLDPAEVPDLAAVTAAYEDQMEAVEAAGGRIILMASRALAAAASDADDYVRVYGRLLDGAAQPVILHWLGPMFDPALSGYWGHDDPWAALEVCLALIEDHAAKVDGIKVSLLDAALEVAMRRRLPAGVRLYTGDDFNYPALIAGDAEGHSDALLGIFDPIAPAAARALAALAAGDRATYDAVLAPTLPLAREIFCAPTRFYKTGVVFLAWLNGHQDAFAMLGGQESARSAPHLSAVFRLADQAGLLADPDRAAARFAQWLAVHAGVA